MGFQFNTDFSTIEPNEGGGSSFPVSDTKGWLCEMIASEGKENSKKDGQILAIQLRGLEGPVNGKLHDFTVNIANPNQQAVQIGMGELSAIAHVTGHIRVGNSAEWHNKPFRVVVVQEIDKATKEPTGRTRITKFLDANGNGPKDAGKGAMVSGGNFGGNAAQQGGFQQNTGGQQQDPNASWGNGQGQNNSQHTGGSGLAAGQNGGGFANAGTTGDGQQFNNGAQSGGSGFSNGQTGQPNAQGGTPNPGSTFQPNNQQGGGFQQNNGGQVQGGGWNR